MCRRNSSDPTNVSSGLIFSTEVAPTSTQFNLLYNICLNKSPKYKYLETTIVLPTARSSYFHSIRANSIICKCGPTCHLQWNNQRLEMETIFLLWENPKVWLYTPHLQLPSHLSVKWNVNLFVLLNISPFYVSERQKLRQRTQFLKEQTAILELHFTCSQYVTPKHCRELAKLLHLKEDVVRTWFSNRRAKDRRLRKRQQSSAH